MKAGSRAGRDRGQQQRGGAAVWSRAQAVCRACVCRVARFVWFEFRAASFVLILCVNLE